MNSTLIASAAEVRPAVTLADLKVEINHYHRECEAAVGKALETARKAGELLVEAKRQLGHGRFLPWLGENFDGSERTAQQYMRIARNWKGLSEIRSSVADLSIRDAIATLTKPTTADLIEENGGGELNPWEVAAALVPLPLLPQGWEYGFETDAHLTLFFPGSDGGVRFHAVGLEHFGRDPSREEYAIVIEVMAQIHGWATAAKGAAIRQNERPDNLPALATGVRYLGRTDDTIFEFTESVKHPGYWYTARFDSELQHCDYSRKPMLMTPTIRQSCTAVHKIPAGLEWEEYEADDHEPWFVTEPLPDGRNPVTLCEPMEARA